MQRIIHGMKFEQRNYTRNGMLLERNMGDMIEISNTQNNVSSTKKMETDLSDLSDSWRINYSRFFSDKSDKSASLIIFTIKLHGYPFL